MIPRSVDISPIFLKLIKHLGLLNFPRPGAALRMTLRKKKPNVVKVFPLHHQKFAQRLTN